MLARLSPLAVGFALWAGVPFLLWHFTPAPFGWIGLWLAALLMITGIKRKQALPFNLAWLFVLIGGAEVGLWAAAPDPGRVLPANGMARLSGPHEDLGYAPVAGRTVRTRRELDGETVYDVTYHIGDTAWRKAPAPTQPAPDGAVLCFGCSFMFGHGVADEETLPSVLEGRLESRQRVYNLAFLGWGPHQMLAALESGLVAATVAETPRYAFFLTSAGHAGRAAGRRRWDKRGPRYVLQEDGRVQREGTFAALPHETYWERRARKFLGKSWILKALHKDEWRSDPPEDHALWFAISAQARDFVESTWPGCEFHVLLWDTVPAADAEFVRSAEAAQLRVHRMSEALPGFTGDWLPWTIDRADPHPTAQAHAAIADYLATQVLGSTTPK